MKALINSTSRSFLSTAVVFACSFLFTLTSSTVESMQLKQGWFDLFYKRLTSGSDLLIYACAISTTTSFDYYFSCEGSKNQWLDFSKRKVFGFFVGLTPFIICVLSTAIYFGLMWTAKGSISYETSEIYNTASLYIAGMASLFYALVRCLTIYIED